MQIFVTGGTGFVGKVFVRRCCELGHDVTILTRSVSSRADKGSIQFVSGDPTRSGSWQDKVGAHDAVVNLAGASIFRRWDSAGKKEITTSRIATTENLVNALSKSGVRTRCLVNASAIGYYGNHDTGDIDEKSPRGSGFLAELTESWESTALRAEAVGIRVVLCRFGVVLGQGGGVLASMLPAFKMGFATPMGSGRQWFSWIHLDDLVEAILFCIEKAEIRGPVNCTAPAAVTNAHFTRKLAHTLHRPAFLPSVPAFALRLALGEMASVLVEGQKVRPGKLLSAGFTFKYQNLKGALGDLTGN